MLAGKKTKVGIAVPQMFPYGPVDMGFVEEHLRLVESLGYDSVWTQDSVLGTMDTLDPFTLLAYASTVTREGWPRYFGAGAAIPESRPPGQDIGQP